MGTRLTNPLICIVGPTASGKTTLAQKIAERLGCGVLSADSMQVYRGMDIGTGKIPPEDRTVPYYGLDLVDPGDPFSASLYQEYGRRVVEERDADRSTCVVCGGTGFYIRALVDEFDFPRGEQVGNPVRDRYACMLDDKGPLAVWECLNVVDPDSAAIIPPNDSKRVIRALEMYAEGVSYALQREKFAHIDQHYSPLCMIGLAVAADVLSRRIDARVERMFEQGLEDEVRSLIAGGYRNAITASQAIGYKEVVSYFDGECSRDEAKSAVKHATRQYAKRQRTWFRKDARIGWIDANDERVDSILDAAFSLMRDGLCEVPDVC